MKNLSILSIIGLSLISLISFAETPQEKGLSIAKKADQRDIGWGNVQSTLKMILINRRGKEVVREIRSRALEIKGDGDKSLVIFDRPRTVKGTAFLSFSHTVGQDDQWLYLPALKRVKRISSSNKSGPFMGSEFSFEDMSSQEVDKYSYKYIKDEACGTGLNCFVIERYPTDPNSGYTKQIVWIDNKEYRFQKSEYYDRKEALLKTLTVSEYKKYLGKYWRAHQWVMLNEQNGKKTILKWADYKFQTGLTEQDFDKNSLKRIK
jgi:outer membrane lipoprotein-sorting protein